MFPGFDSYLVLIDDLTDSYAKNKNLTYFLVLLAKDWQQESYLRIY